MTLNKLLLAGYLKPYKKKKKKKKKKKRTHKWDIETRKNYFQVNGSLNTFFIPFEASVTFLYPL